jgi:cyanate permease
MVHAEPVAPRTRDHKPRRWGVLAAFICVVAVSQMLWLNFAPLLAHVQRRYQVDELTASLLVLVFPLLYVGFSVHAGAVTDRRGYRFTVGLGALLMVVGASVRIADAWFWPLLLGQITIAVAQPYVVNGISKLVTDWFDDSDSALATGLGTMGMFLGMALGMATTPPLVDALGLRATMIAFAAIAGLAAGAFALWGGETPAAGRARAVAANHTAAPDSTGPSPIRLLLRDRRLVILAGLAFLGLGIFNGLTTWLELIVAPHGIDAVQAGAIGGVIIVGGIVGAVVIPFLSDRTRRRKPFLLLGVSIALAVVYPLCTGREYGVLLALGGVLGFFFLPAFALLLEMCAQVAGPRHAGAATSLLMLAGNAGGVTMILAMDGVKRGADFQPAVLLVMSLLAVTLVAAAALAPETFARVEAK